MLTVPPTATTPALLLRPWTEQDIPAMVEAHRDPVMRQWLRHPVTNADEARRIIQTRRADSEAGIGFSFAVLLAEPEGPMTWSAASASGDWTVRLSRAKLATGSRQPHAGEASPREPSTSYASGPSACHGPDRWKSWNSSTASATAPPAG